MFRYALSFFVVDGKMPDGTDVFRNSRLEEREAKRFEADRQQRREKLFLQVQEEFEKESGQLGLILSVKSVTLFNPLSDPHRLALMSLITRNAKEWRSMTAQ